MAYRFAFYLTNGTTEYHSFTACEYRFARQAAWDYSRTAFAAGELYEFAFRP